VDGGLLVVDKPAGCTSHDVVARVRRLVGTRRVGHAGTLDPAATGVQVCGVGRATRLHGHLQLADKEYTATIRLGVSTTTDDAEGEVLARRPTDAVTDAAIASAVDALTGVILQIPSAVSAIKVGGVRAYARVRAGEAVELAAREVTVDRFEVLARRSGAAGGETTDELDVVVACSTGTYIRALARDLGTALGCGAHLTALRRIRVGAFTLDDAGTLAQHAEQPRLIPLGAAVAMTFPRHDVSATEAEQLRHGRPIAASGQGGPVGVFGPDGRVLALVQDAGSSARPLVVLHPA
jgi:tRNA pseudouridine55 synthase